MSVTEEQASAVVVALYEERKAHESNVANLKAEVARLTEERDKAREVQARCEDNCKRRTARMIRAEDERDAARAVCKEQEALEAEMPYLIDAPMRRFQHTAHVMCESAKALRAALGKDGE